MENVHEIIEIDISKQARALAWLRLTDYALVVIGGLTMMGIVSSLFDNATQADAGSLIYIATLLPILGFAVYTGWRHVGVIDPRVWVHYRIVFPLLILCSAFILFSLIVAFLQMQDVFSEQRKLEVIQAVSAMFSYLWIGGTAAVGWLSLIALRRMKIVGTNSTITQVLLDLSRQSGSRAEQATHIRRINPTRGYMLGFTGLLVLIVVAFAPTPGNKLMAEFWLRNSWQFGTLGFFLLVRARRYFQVDADSLLAVDRRAPILFLRSFDDDEKQVYTGSDKALIDFSLETRLSNHFSHFGPFIAIGSPKESIPQLGAARVLLSDDEWQPRVLGWMQDSQLIVMYSGKTHWVNWELRQVLNNGATTRLILMIPEIKGWRRSKRQAEINERVAQIREVFKNTPWEEELMGFQDFMGLRAMLFRPDGSMVMIKSRSRSRDAYHLAALIAHDLLLNPAGENTEATTSSVESRFRFAYGIALGIILALAIGSFIFLGGNDYGDKLIFGKGEVYYKKPVSQEEAQQIGQYLSTKAYFDDQATRSIQFLKGPNGYETRFVVRAESLNLSTEIEFSLLARDISNELLHGNSVRAVLADARLKSIKALPKYDVRAFGKGRLYSSPEIAPEIADTIGQFLANAGFFDNENGAAIYLGQVGGEHELRFIVDPTRARDREIKDAFAQLGRMISAQALGDKPIVVNLCDNTFGILSSIQVDTKLNPVSAP